MKKSLKLLALGLVSVMMFASCGKNNGNGSNTTTDSGRQEVDDDYINSFNPADYPVKDDVTVTIQMCGLGREWIDDLTANYKKITGINVTVKEGQDVTGELNNKMALNKGFSDLYFDWTSYAEWSLWANDGKLADISDIYPEIAPIKTEQVKSMGEYKGKLYTINLAYQPTGFVYNQEYLDVIDSYGEYTKGVWPASWQGLLDLCEATQKSSLKVGGTKVQPFIWGGTVMDMYYIFKALWAQTDPAGFENYFNYNDVTHYERSIFENDGTITAMQAIRDLLNPKQNSKGAYYPANAVTGSTGINNTRAETMFLNGAAVFTITGSWFENEMAEVLEDEDFYHFGRVPLLSSENKSTVNINLPGEHFTIPAKADNVEGAKQFLKFMLHAKNLVRIQNIIQVPLAFNFDESDLKLTRWAKECKDVLSDSVGVVCWSESEVFQCGALGFFETDDPFVSMATTGSTAAEVIKKEADKRIERFPDYIDRIPKKN